MQKKFVISNFLFIVLLQSSTISFSQPIALFVDSILNNKTIKIPAYQQKNIAYESRFYKMNFAKSSFLDTAGLAMINDAEILSISLVFTDFPSNLDLKPLNKSRFIQLNKYLPNAIKNKYIRWQVIRQMDGFDKKTAENMLHGFVINYRLPVTKKSWQNEMDYIYAVTPEPVKEEVLPEDIPPPPRKKVNNWNAKYTSQISYTILFDRTVKKVSQNKLELQKYYRKKDSLIALSTQQALQYKVVIKNDENIDLKRDSVYVLLDALQEDESKFIPPRPKPQVVIKKDSTFFNAIERNGFRNLLVVADVTTSMSPYNAQVIQWVSKQINKNNLKAMVCFNDGDGKKQEDKIIGSTGGIYGAVYENPTQIGTLFEDAMRKGSGGDLQENDCEALIKAIEMFSDYDEIILVADSWAPVRDIELVHKIKKPVKVLVCGNELGPHPDYVTIALYTNGSLHFADDDVLQFFELKAGKVQNIHGTNYIVKADGKVAYAK